MSEEGKRVPTADELQEAAELAIPGGLTVVTVHPIVERPEEDVHPDAAVGKLVKPWNAAEVGTCVTTDRALADEMGWTLVDEVRFEALESGGFFEPDANAGRVDVIGKGLLQTPSGRRSKRGRPPNDDGANPEDGA